MHTDTTFWVVDMQMVLNLPVTGPRPCMSKGFKLTVTNLFPHEYKALNRFSRVKERSKGNIFEVVLTDMGIRDLLAWKCLRQQTEIIGKSIPASKQCTIFELFQTILGKDNVYLPA